MDSTQNNATAKRGRPSGRTAQGKSMKMHLYKVSLEMIEKEGFEKATLRKIAQKAKVSPGLIYKYFPCKNAIVLELHEQLTADFELKAQKIKPGGWVERSSEALSMSLETLKPHRDSLQSLIPVLVGNVEKNVFSDFSNFARERVEGVFYHAVVGAKNSPPIKTAEALGRITFTIHMAVLMFWLLDKSKNQKSTAELLKLYTTLLKPIALSLKFTTPQKLLQKVDSIIQSGLIGV